MRLGFDPEFFLKNKVGEFVSSIGLIGGSKEFPLDIGDGCALQEDNVAVEFNTPPCSSPEEAIRYFRYAQEKTIEKIQDMGLEIAIVPSAEFNPSQLDNPAARQFGCDPDYNAWTLQENPRPQATNSNLRSAGGHIHVETDKNIIQVVRALDVYVGAWLSQRDMDKKRRLLYGKAGAFRPKDYGVEYRTPSNYWISSDDLIMQTWKQVEKALSYVSQGKEIPVREDIIQAVNLASKPVYKKLNEEFTIE